MPKTGEAQQIDNDFMYGIFPDGIFPGHEEQDEQPAPELEEFEKPDMTVDRVCFDNGFLVGMREGVEIVRAGQFPDIDTAFAAMPLYDKDGSPVTPEPAPDDPAGGRRLRADVDYIAIMTGVDLNV